MSVLLYAATARWDSWRLIKPPSHPSLKNHTWKKTQDQHTELVTINGRFHGIQVDLTCRLEKGAKYEDIVAAVKEALSGGHSGRWCDEHCLQSLLGEHYVARLFTWPGPRPRLAR